MDNKPGVYILQSLKNYRYYIGSTNNIRRRLKEHQTGKVKATQYLLPLELKIFHPTMSLKQARQIEYKLKKYKNKKIIEQIIRDQKIFLKDV